MRCYECGGTYQRQHGELMLFNDSIGPYSLHNSNYEKCDKCGDLLFSPATLQAIETRIDEIRNEYILNEPIGAFISAADASAMLGITRQALHKHRRIRRGFIYCTTIGGVKVYHKKSVELFRDTKDGRFPFYRPVSTPASTQYKESHSTLERTGKHSFGPMHFTESSISSFIETKVKKPEGVNYV